MHRCVRYRCLERRVRALCPLRNRAAAVCRQAGRQAIRSLSFLALPVPNATRSATHLARLRPGCLTVAEAKSRATASMQPARAHGQHRMTCLYCSNSSSSSKSQIRAESVCIVHSTRASIPMERWQDTGAPRLPTHSCPGLAELEKDVHTARRAAAQLSKTLIFVEEGTSVKDGKTAGSKGQSRAKQRAQRSRCCCTYTVCMCSTDTDRAGGLGRKTWSRREGRRGNKAGRV